MSDDTRELLRDSLTGSNAARLVADLVRRNPGANAVRFDATDGRLQGALTEQLRQARIDDALVRLRSHTALRPKDPGEAGIIRARPRVEVEVVRGHEIAEDGTRRLTGSSVVEVRVFSLMRPGAFSRVLMPPGMPSVRDVMIVGGALCEQLCEDYGDPFDPDEAADMACTEFLRARAAL